MNIEATDCPGLVFGHGGWMQWWSCSKLLQPMSVRQQEQREAYICPCNYWQVRWDYVTFHFPIQSHFTYNFFLLSDTIYQWIPFYYGLLIWTQPPLSHILNSSCESPLVLRLWHLLWNVIEDHVCSILIWNFLFIENSWNKNTVEMNMVNDKQDLMKASMDCIYKVSFEWTRLTKIKLSWKIFKFNLCSFPSSTPQRNANLNQDLAWVES